MQIMFCGCHQLLRQLNTMIKHIILKGRILFLKIFDYDRRRAYEYALRWAYRRNPLFYDFTQLGGDCTSFVSQCIFAGCCTMNFSADYGWYFISTDERAPAWTGVEFLYDFLTSNEDVGPFGNEALLREIHTGDVIQLADEEGDYYHSLLVIGRDADELLVSAHSTDVFARPLSSYDYGTLRAIRIEGYRSARDMCDCFEGLLSGTRLETCRDLQ